MTARRIALSLVLLLAVAALPAGARARSVAAPDRPLVSAHRGGAAYAPENTMVAFQNAVRIGADDLELDVQLTADGRLAVLHDDTLDRTTDCTGTVSSRTWAQLAACDAAYWFSPGQPTTAVDPDAPHPLRGTGVRIPEFAEVLEYARALGPDGPTISAEIKDIPGESNFDPAGETIARVLVPQIQASGIAGRIVVQSFWPAALEAVKRLDPTIATLFLTTQSFGQTAMQNLAYTTARGHQVSAPNFDATDAGTAWVQAAHAAGKRAVPWTVDRRAELERVAAWGVDGIITNFPGCLLELQGRLRSTKVVTPEATTDTQPLCHEATAVAKGPRALRDIPDRPAPAVCAALRPGRWEPGTGVAASGMGLRVIGLQYKQDVRHVAAYESFRTKMRCLMEDHVVPLLRPGVPTLVVYNEDIGLMTLATGSRGRATREQAATPLRGPAGDVAPVGIAAALGSLNAAYAPQVAAYQARFGPIDPRKQVFVAATDTFARAYSQTFSDIARDYGVYVVASNNQAPYRASTDPAEIALFGDPDLGAVGEVYVATSATVTNQTHLWSPAVVDASAPAGERNLVFRNHKVPITQIERDLIALDEGPWQDLDAAKANAAGAEVAGFRLGFATSLPAFAYGYPFGERPAGLDPCADVRQSFMTCMDALGVDVVVQAEANPGRWAAYQPGGWQPLEWMSSTWRAVADPDVGFRYNVTPHMVGNLLDLVFDGQSAITKRGAVGAGRHYVGDGVFLEGTDPEPYRIYAGAKPEFIALAPWVVADADRDTLRAVGDKLAPGSGDAMENDYLETAVWADFTR